METQLPILYSFRRCPYAIRARMALYYANVKYEHREIELKNKPQSMLDISSKGTVPVFLLPNQTVIDESYQVMLWALEQQDSQSWFYGLDDKSQQAIESLVNANDYFKPQLDRYKYADRYPESDRYYRGQAEDFVLRLENCLTNSNYLISNQITLADIAIFPFIRQFAFVDKAWFDQSPYHALQQWLANFLENDLFTQVMHKHQLWKDVQ